MALARSHEAGMVSGATLMEKVVVDCDPRALPPLDSDRMLALTRLWHVYHDLNAEAAKLFEGAPGAED